MKKRKKLKLKKSVIFLSLIVIVIPMAFSSFKVFSYAVPVTNLNEKNNIINDYVKSISNLVEEREIDYKYVNVVSLEDDRYISKLFNFKTGEEVSIENIIKPEKVVDFWDKVTELLYLKYPKFIADVLSKNDKTNAYYVKENELIIYYYDYLIEPFINEELSLHVNFNEIKECMDITVKLDKTYENEDGNKIDLNKKIVALTFDDGPGPYTSRLVDILNDNKARATFFMLGKKLSLYKDEVKKVYDKDYNQKFKYEDVNIYLYVDAVSYYYHNPLNFKDETGKEFYYKISNGEKMGYISIEKNENDYFLKIIYNYAKIEANVPKEKLNEVIANSMIILNSIDYNDNLIKKILEDEYYSSTAEEYKIRKPENTTSKFSEYLSEYVVDEETVIPDLPEY